MGRMSELCIDIENMFFIDRMDMEDIAKELNVPVDMVQNYILEYDDEIMYEDDGQLTEMEEWRDFDPDCQLPLTNDGYNAFKPPYSAKSLISLNMSIIVSH